MKVAYPQFQQVHFGVRSTPPALMEDSFLGDSGTSIVQVVCSRVHSCRPRQLASHNVVLSSAAAVSQLPCRQLYPLDLALS